jgi:hypothetical protein
VTAVPLMVLSARVVRPCTAPEPVRTDGARFAEAVRVGAWVLPVPLTVAGRVLPLNRTAVVCV